MSTELSERQKACIPRVVFELIPIKNLVSNDVKTVQQNAGHYSAAFTLDRYAHVIETMRRESADRMQNFFEAL